jgi:hypothetical protein
MAAKGRWCELTEQQRPAAPSPSESTAMSFDKFLHFIIEKQESSHWLNTPRGQLGARCSRTMHRRSWQHGSRYSQSQLQGGPVRCHQKHCLNFGTVLLCRRSLLCQKVDQFRLGSRKAATRSAGPIAEGYPSLLQGMETGTSGRVQAA